eukprot:TRINITY_DN29024_c0_g1_i1.p1 TRINITY_DN29024_c0_g1~~TRINITY_DN29024_c0_g1_i1.p1  ORF type:complete len:1072 (+),score=141.82 TRINITY_DN29024_c0_g1_i1:56-3271(+)
MLHPTDSNDATYHLPSASSPVRSYKMEFVAGPFKHNAAVATLLGPCILPIAALSGKFTLTILLTGLIIAYILDFLNMKAYTLLTLWAALVSVWMSLYFSNILLLWQSTFNLFILMNASWFILLLGLWGTVQFRWFQILSPELTLVAERLLIGLTPVVVTPLFFNTIVGLRGVVNAPFLLAGFLCFAHRLMFRRRKSSWKVSLSPQHAHEEFVQGRVECLLFSLITAILPAAVYLFVQHRVLQFSVTHLLNLLGLVAIPTFYLWYDALNSLWWLFPIAQVNAASPTRLQSHPALSVRPIVLLVSYLCVQHWFQHRILVSRYGHLLLGLPPPYNSIALTIAFYCCSLGGFFALQLLDLSEKRERGLPVAGRWIAVLFLSIAASTLFALVLGMPRFILPFAALSAACLTAYCLDRRTFNNFVLFAVCTTIMMAWWMLKSFSFLILDLPLLLDATSITLQTLSWLILVLFMVSCALFVASFHAHAESEEGRMLFTLLCFLHAALFTFVEHVMYSQTEAFYPAVFIFVTTGLGFAMAHRLRNNGKLSLGQSSLVIGTYASKLVVFIAVLCRPQDSASLSSVQKGERAAGLCGIWAATVLAATLVALLHLESSDKQRRVRIRPGIFYFISSGIFVFLSRDSIVAALVQLFAGTTRGSEVGFSRQVGLAIVFWGLLLAPVCFKYLAVVHSLRRVNALILIVGSALSLLEPALTRFDETVLSADSDVLLYQPPWWVGWTGLASGTLVGTTLFSVIKLPHNPAIRYLWWGLLAVVSAITFSATFLPYVDFHVTLFVCLIFLLAVLTLDLGHFPKTPNQFSPCVVVYLAFLAISILTHVTATRADFTKVTKLTYAVDELRHTTGIALVSLFATSNLALAIILKAKLSGVPLIRSEYIGTGKDSRFLLVPAKSLLPLGLVVNISCISGFLCMAHLNILINESNVFVFVLLSSLLLLLHQDNYFFSSLNPEKQRYVPPLVNIETLLGMITLVELRDTWLTTSMLANVLALLLVVPSHLVLWRFLNTFKSTRALLLVLSVLFDLISIVSTTLPAVRWLALTGTIGIVAQCFALNFWSRQKEQLL